MIQAPNFTQIPNDVIDRLMLDLTGAEFKVVMVICRDTFGWHRESTPPISLSKLAERAGVTRSTAQAAASKLESLGVVARAQGGSGTRYKIRVAGPSPARAPEPKPDPKPVPEPESDSGQRDLFGQVATVCGLNTALMSGKDRVRVAKAAKALREASVSSDLVAEAGTRWGVEDWRGRRGDRPTPEQLLTFVGSLARSRKDARGSQALRDEYEALQAEFFRRGGRASGQPPLPPFEEWATRRAS